MTFHEFLDRLLPCKHKWEIFKLVTIYPVNEYHVKESEKVLPEGTKYHLKCSVCGDIKFKNSF